ncbi:MAG TPA: NAD(P)/FAD-dependent oxidoreductase [Solirubrobacteraceae bacterium]|nr:NAD(P)/FAD-dependent oxidoreductase [Solirubrobacteraceae bacterium]
MAEVGRVEAVEHVDVLIIGAGLSGIGCAHYLQRRHPERRYLILEGRDRIGGTWDLFRYPGIRSDSDLHTFGFEFKPWVSRNAIAGGGEILEYLREAAREEGIEQHIRTGHRVTSAAWSSADARWSVTVERPGSSPLRLSASWVYAGTGYYRYDGGYLPELPGLPTFAGRVVHPQRWPQNLDYAGQRVLIVGSGATAVTLVPAMARTAEHVTMLQRSPSYVMSIPRHDALATRLQRWLGSERGYAWTRRKNILQQTALYQFCQRFPRPARRLIRRLAARQLPPGYPVDVHFKPRYDPWDQRLCFVPSGDLFRSIREGRATVVTDEIETFTATGVRLASGQELEADVVVTATGLRLQALGGIALEVDGRPVDISRRVAFRGMMLDGVPNLAFLIGYTNASWTLKVGLVCEHLCRLLSHMDELGADTCVAELPYPNMPTRPLLDFRAGYVQRSLHELPRQGTHAPWRVAMGYRTDARLLRGPVEHRNLHFSRARASEGDAQMPTATSLMV